MTTERILEGQKHNFIMVPSNREWESIVYYDVFRYGHKIARVSIEATAQVALQDARADITDLEDDMMHLFGTDDFTYVNPEELSRVN